jgi:hypothetical protein
MDPGEQPRNEYEKKLMTEIKDRQTLKTSSLIGKSSSTGTGPVVRTKSDPDLTNTALQSIDVRPDSDASIFSNRSGHGSASNFNATGSFEGTKRANGCEFAIKKNDYKMDCYIISFSYSKNNIPQHYMFSGSFLREKMITMELLTKIQDKCWENIRSKCTNEDIISFGSIGLVLFYRKLIVSVGKISNFEEIPFSKGYEILGDLFGVIFVAIQKLEPSGMFSTWQDPESLEDQMKKIITLEDDTMVDGTIQNEKQSLLSWLWGKKPAMGLRNPPDDDSIIF